MFKELIKKTKEVKKDVITLTITILITIISIPMMVLAILFEIWGLAIWSSGLYGAFSQWVFIMIGVYNDDQKELKKIENKIYKKTELLFSQIEQNKE